MNIKQIFLPLLGTLALIGCNKEAVEPTNSNTVQVNSVTLALSIEATADASEMRAVSFDANQNVPPTMHDQYSDWTTHCFLSNEDGSKKAYATINWDARLEGGKVKLKMQGHTLELKPIGSADEALTADNKPAAGERWSIVGITGGGKLNAERTRVDFAPDAVLDAALKPHQARVPFTFEKAYFTVSAASGERAPQISVHFKPQGSLLNVRVNNKISQLVQTELRVVSNALSNNGYYDYSTGEAQWTFVQTEAQPETLSRSIAIDANAGKNYLLWGMPRTASAVALSSKVALGGYKLLAEGSATEQPKVRTEAFVNAIAYPMGVDIAESLSPLNTLPTTGGPTYAAKVMDATTNSFIDPLAFSTAEAYPSSIYYTHEEALAAYGSSTDKPYYLPTIWELGTIFPSQKSGDDRGQACYFTGGGNANGTPIVEKVQFTKDAAPVEVTSEYRGAGGSSKIVYALRFSGYDGNSKRTAFRYEYFKIKELANGTPLHGLKVTTRHLGNAGDSNSYNTEAYWTNPSKSMQDVTVTYPALGHTSAEAVAIGSAPAGLGSYVYYWSATAADAGFFRTMNFYNGGVRGFLRNESPSALPLILFKK